MTDKELMTFAAKAAGFIFNNATMNNDLWGCFEDAPSQTSRPWNPLESDSDALRLAIKLGLAIHVWGDATTAMTCRSEEDIKCIEAHGNDPYAATRRAIVRAVAEIGKGMK